MIKTSLSTGALLSVDRRSLMTVLDTVVLHLPIVLSSVTHSGFGGRERITFPPSLAFYWGDLLLQSCKSRIMSVNC